MYCLSNKKAANYLFVHLIDLQLPNNYPDHHFHPLHSQNSKLATIHLHPSNPRSTPSPSFADPYSSLSRSKPAIASIRTRRSVRNDTLDQKYHHGRNHRVSSGSITSPVLESEARDGERRGWEPRAAIPRVALSWDTPKRHYRGTSSRNSRGIGRWGDEYHCAAWNMTGPRLLCRPETRSRERGTTREPVTPAALPSASERRCLTTEATAPLLHPLVLFWARNTIRTVSLLVTRWGPAWARW